jgi:fructan beta-fructosidase
LDIHSIEFRDPKVFWYSPQQKWIMIVSKPDRQQVYFYASKNLKEWTFLSRWGRAGNTARVWECPDLMEMSVAGTNEKKWVLIVSAGHQQETFLGMQYFVGDFDGQKFTPVQNDEEPVYLDYGKDFYAAVSFSNMPNNRKVVVGWLNNWEYANDIPTGNVWRGAYAVPRELGLTKTIAGYQLMQQPIVEMNAHKKEVLSISEQMVDSVFHLPFKNNVFEMELTVEPGTAKSVGLKILKSKNEETILKYESETNTFSLDRMRSGNSSFHKKFPSIEKAIIPLFEGKYKLHLLVDKCVVEVFINDGLTTMTDLVFPIEKESGIQLFTSGGKAKFSNIKIWTVKM